MGSGRINESHLVKEERLEKVAGSPRLQKDRPLDWEVGDKALVDSIITLVSLFFVERYTIIMIIVTRAIVVQSGTK
jgi:hypothetical protein